MPHSLRAKLSGLRYKGILEDKDYKRLCKALDNEKALDRIRAEIKTEISDYEGYADFYEGIRFGLRTTLEIIDNYIKRLRDKE